MRKVLLLVLLAAAAGGGWWAYHRQEAAALPDFLAASFAPQVMEDAAIVQRIDWALDVLFLHG